MFILLLCANYLDPSLNSYPDIQFARTLMAKMPKSEKGHYSVKTSQNFTKVNQIIYLFILCIHYFYRDQTTVCFEP